MSDGPAALLKQWVGLTQNPSSEGFVFPSENLSTPLSADNVWRRNLKPGSKKLGWNGRRSRFLRKTNASLSKKEGIDQKVAADQRGHGIGVSLEVYTMSDMAQKKAAVKKLEAAVVREPQQKLSA